MSRDHGRRQDVRWKETEARKAQQVADKLACEASNERMVNLGGPLDPSLRAAINRGLFAAKLRARGHPSRRVLR